MENEALIISKLDSLKAELESIKEHIIDITLTSEDFNAIKAAEEDLAEGKTKRL